MFNRRCAFQHDLQIEILLGSNASAYQTAVFDFAVTSALSVGFQSPLEIIILGVDQDPVVMTAPTQHRLFRLEFESSFVGLAFDTVQASFERFETGTTAKSQLVSVDGLIDARSDFLCFIDAKFGLATGLFAVAGNDSMQIVFCQLVLTIKRSKNLRPFLALRHRTCLTPCGILSHLLKLAQSRAQSCIVQLSGIFKFLHNRATFRIVDNDRQFHNKALRRHNCDSNGAHSSHQSIDGLPARFFVIMCK